MEIQTALKGVMYTSWEIASDWSRGQVPLVRWTGQWLDRMEVSAANAEVGWKEQDWASGCADGTKQLS